MIDVHADVVGSLLRPERLQRARQSFEAGGISVDQMREQENEAVDQAIALQEGAGLPVVNDGEMRRLSFQDHFVQAVQGLDAHGMNAYLWGDWKGDTAVGDVRRERPPDLSVRHRLQVRRQPLVEEFTYLRERTTRLPKITMTAPSLWVNFYDPQRSAPSYPTLDAFLADVLMILRDEVRELVRRGARYIQLDAPHYTAFLDPSAAAFYEGRWQRKNWLHASIELDNALMQDVGSTTFGFHLCRGNQESRWLVEGGYDALSKEVFPHLGAQRLLLEYDDRRSGGFAPLADIPDDKMVVLGLVGTKHSRTPDVSVLEQRVAEASGYMDRERLALSTQCGFSSSVLGNRISPEDQRNKLRQVAEAAAGIWGPPTDLS